MRRELLAIRDVRLRYGSASSPRSSMNVDDVMIAPSGVRRSWPRIAMNISFDWLRSAV
jgi:hypothetical protein